MGFQKKSIPSIGTFKHNLVDKNTNIQGFFMGIENFIKILLKIMILA